MFVSARAAGLFIVLSLIFFHITATTFASLGVVLPAMIAELGWSWTQAGFGFTALALFTGLFSPVAAESLKRLGLRGNYSVGGGAMAAGFAMLAMTKGLFIYLAAASLLGAGFALLANVPSTFVITQTVKPASRNFMIGAYLAAGGFGGVAGPLLANAMIAGGEDWRLYWRLAALVIVALGAALLIFADSNFLPRDAKTTKEVTAREKRAPGEAAGRDWTLREALRAPAFYLIGGALMAAYFCGVSVSSWAVTHLTGFGLTAGFASAMLSLHAASNAIARAAGGVAVKFTRARYLLLAGLAAEAVGMIALSFAVTPVIAIIFALFEGFAFGMILFATTVLAIDYFGLKNSPAILGAMNLFATVAMLGPTLTGMTGDAFGTFSPIFLVYGAGAGLLSIAGVFIHNPNPDNR
ncbi:MFS transporter [Hyphococcus sp.]|uniref:MFS transporter n=1 Tax=Hyphococcus sp. TaxID=2038636 RepID=UPI002083176B|nr:MAG: MFS transporter [Marinicaulis sp.]